MSFRQCGNLLPCLWLHFIVSISIHAIALADLERAQRGECYALWDWNMKLNTKRTAALQRWAFVSAAIYCCVGGWIGNGGSGCRLLSMDAWAMRWWRWLSSWMEATAEDAARRGRWWLRTPWRGCGHLKALVWWPGDEREGGFHLMVEFKRWPFFDESERRRRAPLCSFK